MRARLSIRHRRPRWQVLSRPPPAPRVSGGRKLHICGGRKWHTLRPSEQGCVRVGVSLTEPRPFGQSTASDLEAVDARKGRNACCHESIFRAACRRARWRASWGLVVARSNRWIASGPLDRKLDDEVFRYKKRQAVVRKIDRYKGDHSVTTGGVPVAERGAGVRGNANLNSWAGANGYFQVMPSTFRTLKIKTNIEAGIKYLSQMIRRFDREDYEILSRVVGHFSESGGVPRFFV